LDAIHLAAALRVAPIAAVITYDERMVAAATSLGLTVMAPGGDPQDWNDGPGAWVREQRNDPRRKG
jgi:hypothetical protein